MLILLSRVYVSENKGFTLSIWVCEYWQMGLRGLFKFLKYFTLAMWPRTPRCEPGYSLPRLEVLGDKSKHVTQSHLIRFPGYGYLILHHLSSLQNLGSYFAKGHLSCRVHQVTVFCVLFFWQLLSSLNAAFPVLCSFQGKNIIISIFKFPTPGDKGNFLIELI